MHIEDSHFGCVVTISNVVTKSLLISAGLMQPWTRGHFR